MSETLKAKRIIIATSLSEASDSTVRTGVAVAQATGAVPWLVHAADLAILGTHGRRGFDRFLLGSVTSGVMHRSTCNLLVVPPGAALLQEEAAKEQREQIFGGDWKFIPDEAPAAAGRI